VVTPDEPMHVEANAPVQPTENPKNPNRRQKHSPVDPTHKNASIGSTGDKEKFCPSRAEFFQPATWEKFDD